MKKINVNLEFTGSEIQMLVHTTSESFYHEQPDRFELHFADDMPDKGVLEWCGENYLNAKVVYEYHKLVDEGTGAADVRLLWDTEWSEWVVWHRMDYAAWVAGSPIQ